MSSPFKGQAKPIIFSIKLWTLLLPPAQTEQRCSASSNTDVPVFRTQKQVAFSGVPQLTLTWSLTDLSHLHSLPSHEDTATCQLQADELHQRHSGTIRSGEVQPLGEDRCPSGSHCCSHVTSTSCQDKHSVKLNRAKEKGCRRATCTLLRQILWSTLPQQQINRDFVWKLQSPL